MRASSMAKHKMLLLAVIAAGLHVLLSPAEAAAQKHERSQNDLELALQFAPVLYFHPAELFRPQTVDVLVDTARLRQIRPTWLDINVLREVSLADLPRYKSANYALDAWLGDEGTSDYKNYSAHRQYYQNSAVTRKSTISNGGCEIASCEKKSCGKQRSAAEPNISDCQSFFRMVGHPGDRGW